MNIRIKYFILAVIFASFVAILFISVKKISQSLVTRYEARKSVIIYDRNHDIIAVKPNADGSIALYADNVTENFKKQLLAQEDKYFYYHLGVNPISTLRAIVRVIFGNAHPASSTLTQQLVKILFNHEADRSIKNKLMETLDAVALELTQSKEKILTMYANSVYLGNNTQGIESASRLYFGKSAFELTDTEALQLTTTIKNPSSDHPFSNDNVKRTNAKPLTLNEIRDKQKTWRKFTQSDAYFELRSMGIDCQSDCVLTIDNKLTKTLRDILARNLQSFQGKNVNNGALVVLKQPENELLAIVGSPDSSQSTNGFQINMAVSPRPIGSTVKPLIYLKAFEKGLRPFTLVDDREYRYPIGTGFALYPKNYDFTYHGIVNLHTALSNSLNVPALKVLEFVGTDAFYNFLRDDLKFTPVQPLENYELGIALGELEMPLLNLSYYLSIFSNNGYLKSLFVNIPPLVGEGEGGVSTLRINKQISTEPYIQLVNKILNDRSTGVQQFGIKSSLNLPADNYALKTGTSREFHDSWTVGYTPDFLVGVWVGNSDNTPMDGISGQAGAGNIWSEAMNVLYASAYNKKTPFDFGLLKTFPTTNGNLEYGLARDDFSSIENKLLDTSLITNPHNGDVFLLESNTTIPFKSGQIVDWYVNDKLIDHDAEIFFSPKTSGNYIIRAKADDGKEESVNFTVSL